MPRITDIKDRGLYRAPHATFLCLDSELVPERDKFTLMGKEFTGAAFEFRDGSFRGATRYADGSPIGAFDPADVFPGQIPASRIVHHAGGVTGFDESPYDSDVHWKAKLNGQPFDGMLLDRSQSTPFVTVMLFSNGIPREMREIGLAGILSHREFMTSEPWDVSYAWHDNATLSEFTVLAGNSRIHIGHRIPGRLTASQLDLDAPLFERMKGSSVFSSGFPEHPAALDDVLLGGFLNVWGEFLLEERLRSLLRNPGLGGVDQLCVTVPKDAAFELLEQVILSASPEKLALKAPAEQCRRYEEWFRRRQGASLPIRRL